MKLTPFAPGQKRLRQRARMRLDVAHARQRDAMRASSLSIWPKGMLPCAEVRTRMILYGIHNVQQQPRRPNVKEHNSNHSCVVQRGQILSAVEKLRHLVHCAIQHFGARGECHWRIRQMSRALIRRGDPFHLPMERVEGWAPKGVLLGVHGGEHMPRRARGHCVETQPHLVEVADP